MSVRAFVELIGLNPNAISNYARTGEFPTHLAPIAVLVGVGKSRGDDRQGQVGGDRQTNLDLEV